MGINQYIKIGTRIKEARLAKKIPQKEMARRLSLSVSTYSNYENNYREPKLDLIHKICNELDISLDELLGTSTMNPELGEKISEQLLKHDISIVKKKLNDIFQKQLNGIQPTEDELKFFNNFIFGYINQHNIIIDDSKITSITNDTQITHTDNIDWNLNEILQKAGRKEELTDEERQQFTDYIHGKEFKEHWERMKKKFSASAEHIQRLQTAYEQLNDLGQQKATEQVEMLTEIPKYRKNPDDQ